MSNRFLVSGSLWEKEKWLELLGWLLMGSLEAAGPFSVVALCYWCSVLQGWDPAPLGSMMAVHEWSVINSSSITGVW